MAPSTRRPRRVIVALWLIQAMIASPSLAQSCDDGSVCTVGDACTEGSCSGAPLDAGTCDDGNECTTSDQCQSGVCRGTPVADNTDCNQGCGRCRSGFCAPNLANTGKPCDDGLLCTNQDRCQFGFCFGNLRTCPNDDGNVCTLEVCDPIDGTCKATGIPPCGECQTCVDIGTGQFRCQAASDGAVCDDLNGCTGAGRCQDGQCAEGTPGGPDDFTPTPTATPPLTFTPTPTGACLGDCNGDDEVTVDEVIAGVNIALGSAGITACPAFDGNGDAAVTVDEIVRAVNFALAGCS